jgi:hypothetical protein
MGRVILSAIKTVVVSISLCLAVTSGFSGQVHDRFENICPSLQNATSAVLLQYLNGTTPDQANGLCVTWAIDKLGKERYEPAIPTLAKLLNFRRPKTRTEEIFSSGPSDWTFPAVGALDLIGEKALPEILLVLKADSTSSTARDNAILLWMGSYKDEPAKGVAKLKQEEIEANNDAIKMRLALAIQKALQYCTSQDEAACRQAAATGAP